jgi:hypothetical protein
MANITETDTYDEGVGRQPVVHRQRHPCEQYFLRVGLNDTADPILWVTICSSRP